MSILVQYVDEILTPSDNQIDFMKAKIKSIKKVLTDNSPIPLKEVHLGGSMGKGTMLKHKLDGDLIFIYNKIEDFGNNWSKLSKKVYEVLKINFTKIEIEEAGNLAIHIPTIFNKQEVNFDIVPSYFVTSPKMMKEHANSKMYQGITTIWHTQYLSRYKNWPYYTHVVRLLKDWKKEHDVNLKNFYLELITADVYENFFDKNYQN